jgi:hypothetical protein
MSLAKGVGAMAGLTGAFALPGHLSEAYRAGAGPKHLVMSGADRLAGLKSMGRSVTTAGGLGRLGAKTGRWTWEFMKTAPKWALMLGVPLGLLGSYLAAKQQGNVSPSTVLSQFGKDLEQRGEHFGKTLSTKRGPVGFATNVARGFFLEPEAAASYLYKRYVQ